MSDPDVIVLSFSPTCSSGLSTGSNDQKPFLPQPVWVFFTGWNLCVEELVENGRMGFGVESLTFGR